VLAAEARSIIDGNAPRRTTLQVMVRVGSTIGPARDAT
jgi:hypothetical protein